MQNILNLISAVLSLPFLLVHTFRLEGIEDIHANLNKVRDNWLNVAITVVVLVMLVMV